MEEGSKVRLTRSRAKSTELIELPPRPKKIKVKEQTPRYWGNLFVIKSNIRRSTRGATKKYQEVNSDQEIEIDEDVVEKEVQVINFLYIS